MASTPTTSLLGGVADVARPTASGCAPAPAADAESSNKSSFSDVLEGAQDTAAAPKTQADATSEVKDAGETETKSGLEMHLLLRTRLAKTAAAGGKDVPPDGEVLPVAAETKLPELVLGKATDSKAEPAEKSTGDSAPTDAVATQPVPTPWLPENPVASAAAAVPRTVTPTTGEGDGASAIGDATTSPKREVPTPPAALTSEAAVSDATSPADTEAPAVDAAESNAPAPLVESLLSRFGGKSRVAADSQQSSANSNLSANTVATTGDDTLPKIDAVAATSIKPAGANSERSELRDALKQIDSTLAATNAVPDRNDSAPVVRDTSGVRQYIDASAAATSARVDVPVGKPGWADGVADKVMWMSAQNVSSAEIQLNPPDLGPLSVRVSSHHDQASVFFTSTHAVVRDALDQSLPRLREMFDGQGIQLLDVGVGDQGGARQQAARGELFGNAGKRAADTDDEIDAIGNVTATAARSNVTAQRIGLLDAYV